MINERTNTLNRMKITLIELSQMTRRFKFSEKSLRGNRIYEQRAERQRLIDLLYLTTVCYQ